MKRPLLLLILLGYIAIAVYSVGKTTSHKASLNPTIVSASARLNRLTMVTNDMTAMAHFYNEVFGAELQPASPAGKNLCQHGVVAGVNLLLCQPQDKRTKATPTRHQFHFVVTDLDAAQHRVESAGGKVVGSTDKRQDEKLLVTHDPDGNVIEFTQTAR